jgi:hypothetical protein
MRTDRPGLALLAGDILVASVTTSTWFDTRLKFATLFGAGSPDWKTLRRLDATYAELTTAPDRSLRRVHLVLAQEWSVRFKDLLAEHPGIENDVISVVAGISIKADEDASRPSKPNAVSIGPGGKGLDRLVRWILIGAAAIAALAAVTYHILVRKTFMDGVPPWTHTLLTWPTSSTQPILAGCAAICLGALAFGTYDWHKPTERTVLSVIASGFAATVSTGPMILVCGVVTFRMMTG